MSGADASVLPFPAGRERGGSGERPDIPYIDLARQYAAERDDLLPLIDEVLAGGRLVGPAVTESLEDDLARWLGVNRVITLGSGTDALLLALEALGIGPGDEVITAPNSFIASAAAIARTGARPVFADVGDDLNLDPGRVEAAITPRTRAIMPVHLAGRVCDMTALLDIAARHGLEIVEDAAQAMGARRDDRLAGTFGRLGCFSAHPLKILNATGDAGWLATDDRVLAERIAMLRNQGLRDRDTAVLWGRAARMDGLQAAILGHRLPRLEAHIETRRRHAARYDAALADAPVATPPLKAGEHHIYNSYILRCGERDGLKAWLAGQGIAAKIHYPVPIHLQPIGRSLGHGEGDFPVTERLAGEILSLPIHQYLENAEIDRVAAAVNAYGSMNA